MLYSSIELPASFQADFTQMITNTKQKVIRYSGKVIFSDKKFFKWMYLSPTKKEVCTDGIELLIVDHDLEQVSAYYMAKGLDISKVLSNAKLYKEHIYVAEYEGKKYTIQLNDKGQLQSIAYYDELDNKVQIVFENIQYAKSILDRKKLQCNYPEAYDVIRG
jgi:outer membrane lipoprotein carrier protein